MEPVFTNTTYNWELLKLIEQQTENGVCNPLFDFCYMDGARNFEVDYCAFFLVDKLLKPGGYILFDDLFWTYNNSHSLKNTDFVKAMADDEKSMPHIKQLVDFVVHQHPDYTVRVLDRYWAIAPKRVDTVIFTNENVQALEKMYVETDSFLQI